MATRKNTKRTNRTNAKKSTKKSAGKEKMPQMDLRGLLETKLGALYDIEVEITKALPKMAKAASDEMLSEAFTEHLEETENQIERLDKVFETLGMKQKKVKAEGIRGIVADGEWVIKNVKPEEARDANLIRAAQYVEHYEMAGYMAAIAWATELGEQEAVELLSQNLEEEEAADTKLATMAENIDALLIESQEEEDSEDEDDERMNRSRTAMAV